jgi:hypothetical protein
MFLFLGVCGINSTCTCMYVRTCKNIIHVRSCFGQVPGADPNNHRYACICVCKRVCMYVCVYMCVYVCTCVYGDMMPSIAYIYTSHICTHTHTPRSCFGQVMRADPHNHTYVFVACTEACMYMRIYVYESNKYICMHLLHGHLP